MYNRIHAVMSAQWGVETFNSLRPIFILKNKELDEIVLCQGTGRRT